MKLRCYSTFHEFLLIMQYFSIMWMVNLFRMAKHWNSFEGYCKWHTKFASQADGAISRLAKERCHCRMVATLSMGPHWSVVVSLTTPLEHCALTQNLGKIWQIHPKRILGNPLWCTRLVLLQLRKCSDHSVMSQDSKVSLRHILEKQTPSKPSDIWKLCKWPLTSIMEVLLSVISLQ